MGTYTQAEDVRTIDSVAEVFPICVDMIARYCEEKGIDEKDIHPSYWADVLDDITTLVILPNKRILLKTDSNLYNEYDKEKILYIYNRVYKKLCFMYKQIPYQKGFLEFIGVEKQTLYNWASNGSFDLQEKIAEDNEEFTAQHMMADKGNPIKYMSVLNKKYGWNLVGVSKEKATESKRANYLTGEQLQQIASYGQQEEKLETISQIAQKKEE